MVEACGAPEAAALQSKQPERAEPSEELGVDERSIRVKGRLMVEMRMKMKTMMKMRGQRIGRSPRRLVRRNIRFKESERVALSQPSRVDP